MAVGRAVVRIDANLNEASVREAGQEIEAILESSAEDVGENFARVFTRTANGALKDESGRFASSARAAAGEYGDVFVRDVNGRLRDLRGSFVSESEVMGRLAAQRVREEFLPVIDSIDQSFTAAFRRIGGTSGAEFGNSFSDRVANIFPRLGNRAARFFASPFGQRVSSSVLEDFEVLNERIENTFFEGGIRASGNFARQFRIQMGQALVAVGALGAAAAPLASTISVAAGAATSLAAGLANAAASAASLVGILGAVAQAGTTLSIAFSGFGEVLEAENTEQLNEALRGLSPAAQSAALAVRGLNDEWDSLTANVQQGLFSGLADDIERVGSVLLPRLSEGLASTGSALNGIAVEVANFATSASFVERFQQGLEGNVAILEQLGEAVVPALDGIVNLFLALQPAAERTAAGIAALAQSFADWTNQAGQTQRIVEFMDSAADSASLVVDIIGNLASAFSGVFTAALPAGNQLLQFFVDLTERFDQFANSAAGQNQIAEWASTAVSALGTFEQLLESLGGLFAGLADPELFNAITEVLTEMSDAIQTLPIETLVSGLADFLSQFSEVVGVVLSGVVAFTTIGTVIGLLSPLFSGLATAISLFLNPLGLAVAGILGLAAVSEDFRSTLVEAFNSVLARGQAAFSEISSLITGTLIPSFQQIFRALEPLLSFIAGVLLDGIVLAINGIIDVFIGLVKIITGVVQTIAGLLTGDMDAVMKGLRKIISGVIDSIVGIFKVAFGITIFRSIGAALRGIFRLVRNILGGILQFFGRILSRIGRTVSRGFRAIGRFFGNGFNAIRRTVSRGLSAVVDFFSNRFGAIGNIVGRGIDKIINGFASLPGRIRRLGGSLFNAGRDLLSRLFGGIESAATGAGGLVISIATAAFDRIKGLINSAISQLNSAIPNSLGGGPLSIDLPNNPIPYLARGIQDFQGGLAVVGEQGPELVNLPRGSDVIPHEESRRVAGGTSETSFVYAPVFTGPTSSGERLRELEWTIRYATGADDRSFGGVPA